MITRVKYFNEWRNVIGLGKNELKQECYKLQCHDKRFYTLVPTNSKHISAIEETENNPTKKPKHKWLSQQDKDNIYALYRDGRYYVKEICEMCNISTTTFTRVVKEYELRSKTNEM